MGTLQVDELNYHVFAICMDDSYGAGPLLESANKNHAYFVWDDGSKGETGDLVFSECEKTRHFYD